MPTSSIRSRESIATMPIRPQTATLVDLGKVDTANAPEAAEAFAKLKEALGDEA